MAALPRSDLLPAGYRLPEQRLAQPPPLQYSSRSKLYKISPPVLQLGNLPSEVEMVATWHTLWHAALQLLLDADREGGQILARSTGRAPAPGPWPPDQGL